MNFNNSSLKLGRFLDVAKRKKKQLKNDLKEIVTLRDIIPLAVREELTRWIFPGLIKKNKRKKWRKRKISIIRSSLKSLIALSQRISVEVNIAIKSRRLGVSEKRRKR